MKFKLNDKVKMQANTLWWNKNDVGRIVSIDDCFMRPYEICFNPNCTMVEFCNHEDSWHAKETDIELVYPVLMKVE